MRYLSFDIECCDGRSICEFGYVITDESFNVIEKDCFTVNPVQPFSLLRRLKQDDMKLYFSEDEYYASPEFPEFYDRIRSLLTAPDQTVIGFRPDATRDSCAMPACVMTCRRLISGSLTVRCFTGNIPAKKCRSLSGMPVRRSASTGVLSFTKATRTRILR